MHPRTRESGQALVETALILPMFLMVVIGIIVIGLGVFYQQQLSNTAREAARYAAIHSATAQCPTVPRLPFEPVTSYRPLSYTRCDRPEAGWPFMTASARGVVAGMSSTAIQFTACWSGYRLGPSGTGAWDAPPPGTYDIAGTPTVIDSTFVQCHIDGQDPTVDPGGLPCRASLPTTDQASAASEAPGRTVANTVTVYACYQWEPPAAGFLLIPSQVTLRAVVTEAIERQQ